jgi:hypothetical protein
MNNTRFFFLAAFLFMSAVFLPADTAASRNLNNIEKSEVVQVTGVVRLVGSGHFPELVITSSRVQWYVDREERDKLNDLQHRVVTVEGEETVREMTFASGRPAGTRRELRNIRIISIHD